MGPVSTPRDCRRRSTARSQDTPTAVERQGQDEPPAWEVSACQVVAIMVPVPESKCLAAARRNSSRRDRFTRCEVPQTSHRSSSCCFPPFPRDSRSHPWRESGCDRFGPRYTPSCSAGQGGLATQVVHKTCVGSPSQCNRKPTECAFGVWPFSAKSLPRLGVRLPSPGPASVTESGSTVNAPVAGSALATVPTSTARPFRHSTFGRLVLLNANPPGELERWPVK